MVLLISVKQYNIKSDVALKYKQIPTVTYSNCASLKEHEILWFVDNDTEFS